MRPHPDRSLQPAHTPLQKTVCAPGRTYHWDQGDTVHADPAQSLVKRYNVATIIIINNYTARSYQSYSANFSLLKSGSFQGLIALHLVRKQKCALAIAAPVQAIPTISA